MQHKFITNENFVWVVINKKKRQFCTLLSKNVYFLSEIYKRQENFILKNSIINLNNFSEKDVKEIIENYFYCNSNKYIEEYSKEYFIYYCLPLISKENDFRDLIIVEEKKYETFEKAYFEQNQLIKTKKNTT